MQRPAKPCTPVRFRPQPPTSPGTPAPGSPPARMAESGRRSGLKIRRPRPCRFESGSGHHLQYQIITISCRQLPLPSLRPFPRSLLAEGPIHLTARCLATPSGLRASSYSWTDAASPEISPTFVAYSKNSASFSRWLVTRKVLRTFRVWASRRSPYVETSRCFHIRGPHGPKGAEGVADTTSKRLEGVRPVTAHGSASAAESW